MLCVMMHNLPPSVGPYIISDGRTNGNVDTTTDQAAYDLTDKGVDEGRGPGVGHPATKRVGTDVAANQEYT